MIASWLIDQLVLQGVTDFCIAPGSRSTPLVLAAKHSKATLHVHFDERGLGFHALGIAKATQRPVALIVTSGTAVGNLLPAVMEAHHSQTPLILLTADRPLELRDCSANQATDQVKIFQPFVRFQTDLSNANEVAIRSIAAQSYFHAATGPVQINCPFREPTYLPVTASPGKKIELHLPRLSATCKTSHSRGLILIGKLPKPDDLFPILDLAKKLNWPICADILSNARSFPTPQQIRYFDFIEKPKPEFVLHFGERLTSKRILQWLKEIKPEYLHVSPYPDLQDPERILTARAQSDIPEFCKAFEAPKSNWIAEWKDTTPQFPASDTFTEVHAMQQLAKIAPENFGFFFGNGMPIRDADHFFFPKSSLGFFGNRGLSGIDGNIATIAGLAEKMPMIAMIGDQAALYDLNSLPLLKKAKHQVVLIISNNFGGGIFHHLPMVQDSNFETLWAAAHDLHFEKATEMFGLPYTRDLEKGLTQTCVVELITCRKANHAYQKCIR